MVWLGTISYSVDMIHTIFGKIIEGLSTEMSTPSPFAGSFMLATMFAALFLVSTISYWMFENPTRTRITACWDEKSGSTR